MLAMSPCPVRCSEFVWSLDHDDDPMRHQLNGLANYGPAAMMMGSSESLIFDYPRLHCQDQSSTGTAEADHNSGTSSDKAAKKLNHNANERDRRKRINHLFSYLRSILPPAPYSTKKKSIPATITHVLNYIPELQQMVQRLTRRKEQLLLEISSNDLIMHQRPTKSSNASVVSASRLPNGDVSVQICTYKANRASLSGILPVLELDGLLLLVNASSFESSAGTLFYNLHFKVGEASRFDCELLSEKVKSLLDKQ